MPELEESKNTANAFYGKPRKTRVLSGERNEATRGLGDVSFASIQPARGTRPGTRFVQTAEQFCRASEISDS